MPTAMMAVKAKSRAEEDKVGMGFHRLIDQDPTLSPAPRRQYPPDHSVGHG